MQAKEIKYVIKQDELQHIARAVARKRKNKGLTQGQLAKKTKVSASYISAIENISMTAVSREKLTTIARVLGTQRRELIGRPPRTQKHDDMCFESEDELLIPLHQEDEDSYEQVLRRQLDRKEEKLITTTIWLWVVVAIAVLEFFILWFLLKS